MLQILGWAYDRQPTAVIYSGVAALLFLIALSLRQRFIRPPLAPHVPPFLLRDPKGKLCFITNAFTTPEGLALVERLLGRGAHIILLCHPEDAADPATLQLYAILKHNHPAGSTTLYIEAVDLNSAEAVRSFAKTFESKGAKVPGALGEPCVHLLYKFTNAFNANLSSSNPFSRRNRGPETHLRFDLLSAPCATSRPEFGACSSLVAQL